jgi:hypothetical protein
MTDAELIARMLDGGVLAGRMIADRFEALRAALTAANARADALEQHVADLLVDVPCACGYDNPTDVCMKHLPLVRDLTAKLAKAVEALRELVQLNDDYSPFGGEMFQDRVNRTWDRARATLAEIEGEKR